MSTSKYSKNKIRIAIVTNIIPKYREGFYDRLIRREDLDVTVYCQDHIPGMNFITIHKKYGERVKIIKFISAKREKISWQFLPWYRIFKDYDVVFINGNPRVLSDVLISTVLQLLGRGVVQWTMAHSYKSNYKYENIRLLWSRLFKRILVYTDAEVRFLRSKGFKNNFILGMNNGLDQKTIDAVSLKWTDARLQEWRESKSIDNCVMLLSCARLDTKNKFEQVVEALPLLIAKIPNLIWCLIGDGEEKYNLEKMTRAANLENYVRFVGQIYQEEEIAPWFLSSKVLIHPAAIGLTLLHSFGYGLPVVIHGNSKLHGPEYSAFESEFNGRNFKIGDIRNLADTVIELLSDTKACSDMKENALFIARNKYNVDVMVERFIQIAKTAAVRN
ncbi:MAG: glycosyltransferase [Bacteroidetes bacterium]|nr:glycosyltransferase [Bacteroidota bacterium]